MPMDEAASVSGRSASGALHNSRSMPAKRDGSGAASSADQATTMQIDYNTLEDLANRVEIYRGRHSVVWNCVCKHTRAPLILKGYVKAKMTERNYHQVRREIRLMRQICYTGAVKLLGTFEDSTAIYLVQEVCSKGDLFKKLIRSGGVLEESYVASEVVLPLLLTLEHLHHNKIYHRDIKPENIFFTREGQMKLGDFGLAIDAALERPKSRVGTLDYMAPEVVSLPTADERRKLEQAGQPPMERNYGEKVDVWACGILAYELLVGRPPFEVEDEQETKKRIMHETTLRFPPHVSADAIAFIKTTLAKQAELRPSAADLIHHPWVRPHVAALLDRGTFTADPPMAMTRQPSNKPAATVGGKFAASAAAAGGAVGGGRSASFSAIPAARPGGLHIQVADDSGANVSAPCNAMSSPHGPTTPGPYGPPGMSRKPVWEADHGAAAFTAVRTTGPAGEVPLSPTSPRKPSAGPGAGGQAGGNQLLKAALNANLGRPGAGVGSAAAGQLAAPGGAGGANMKVRLREYFTQRPI